MIDEMLRPTDNYGILLLVSALISNKPNLKEIPEYSRHQIIRGNACHQGRGLFFTRQHSVMYEIYPQ